MMENNFRPTPEELVLFLFKKWCDPAFTDPRIGGVNIYKHHPRELPGLSPIQSDEQVWYFFCTLDYKYAKSERANRKAKGGSWKITGTDRVVKAKHSNKPIGFKKTLVFYQGSNFRKENKTNYVMHEYYEYQSNKDPLFKGKLVVCRIELKPDKKHKPSSSLDEGQSSDSLAYDSPNNAAQDIPEVECHLPQNPHLPSSSNNDVANNNLMEVEPQLLPNHYISHVECDLPQNLYLPSSSNNDVANNSLMEVEPQPLPNQLESQPLPNQLGPQPLPNQLESQPLPNQLGPQPLPNQLGSQPLPNPHNLSSREDHGAKYNFPEPMGSNMHWPNHLPPGSSCSSSFGNVSTKGLLDHDSSSALQSGIHPHPGSSYSSGSVNGLQFAAEQEDDLANSHWSVLDQMISHLQKLDTLVLQTSTHKWQPQEVSMVMEVMHSLRDSLLCQMCNLGSNEDI